MKNLIIDESNYGDTRIEENFNKMMDDIKKYIE